MPVSVPGASIRRFAWSVRPEGPSPAIAASNTMAFARWVITTQGGSASLTVTAPSSTWTTSRTRARVAGFLSLWLGPVAGPGNSRHGQHHNTDQRGGPAVADLDHGGKVERGEPLSVAAGPVVSAPHAGPGNPHHPAEHDQAEGQHCPGPGQAAEQRTGSGCEGVHWWQNTSLTSPRWPHSFRPDSSGQCQP